MIKLTKGDLKLLLENRLINKCGLLDPSDDCRDYVNDIVDWLIDTETVTQETMLIEKEIVEVLASYPHGTTAEMFEQFADLLARFKAAGITEVGGIKL